MADVSKFKVPDKGSFRTHRAEQNISLENIDAKLYLRSNIVENKPFASRNPEKITIQYYKTSPLIEPFRGMPVVLNFTGSTSFLKCCKQDNGAILRVETCDTQPLNPISQQDEAALAFLFYVKGSQSRELKFESVLCPGWFIQVLHNGTVQVTRQPAEEHQSFYFVIHSCCT